MSSPQRLAAFDIAKGIGIILVILGHSPLPSPIGKYIYGFHMPLFFIISGYFLSCKLPIRDYFLKRCRQLMWPYVCGCSIATLILAFVCSCIEIPTTLPHLLSQRLIASLYGLGWSYDLPITRSHIQMTGTFWFLPGLICSLLTVRIALRYRYAWVIVFLSAGLAYISHRFLILPMSIQAGVNASVFVYAGYLAKRYNIIRTSVYQSRWLPWVALMIYVLMARNVGTVGLSVCYYSQPLLNIIAAIGMSYVILRFSEFLSRIPLIGKALAHIGSATLFLFCVHAISQTAITQFTPEYHIQLLSRPATIIYLLVTPFVVLLLRDGIRLLRRSKDTAPLPNET